MVCVVAKAVWAGHQRFSQGPRGQCGPVCLLADVPSSQQSQHGVDREGISNAVRERLVPEAQACLHAFALNRAYMW